MRMFSLSLSHSHIWLCFCLGERLTDDQVDEIIRNTDLQEDLEGNVKYEGKTAPHQLSTSTLQCLLVPVSQVTYITDHIVQFFSEFIKKVMAGPYPD